MEKSIDLTDREPVTGVQIIGLQGVPVGAGPGYELRICLKPSILAAPTLLSRCLFLPLQPGIVQLLTAQYEADRSSECRPDQGCYRTYPDVVTHIRRVGQSTTARKRAALKERFTARSPWPRRTG